MLPQDILRSELTADPLGRGYATMSDDEVAASLNGATIAVWEPVPVEQVKAWAVRQMTPGGQFLLKALKVAAAGDSAAAGLADTILEGVGMNMPGWRMDDDQNIGLMMAAVQAGFLTEAQITGLRALGQKTISRAAQLGLGVVTVGDVGRVR